MSDQIHSAIEFRDVTMSYDDRVILDEVSFVDRAGGHYRLRESSPYRRAGKDGKDIGVDFAALCAAMPDTASLPRACVPSSPSDKRPSHNARPPDS